MGYFDFLDEEEERRKKRNSFTIGNTGPDKLLNEPGGGGDTPKIDPSGDASSIKPDPKVGALGDRNKIAAEIDVLRNQVAEEMARQRLEKAGAYGTGFGKSTDTSLLRESILKLIPRDNPLNIARSLEKYATENRLSLDKIPSFRRLEEAATSLKRAEVSEPMQQYRAEAKVNMAQADTPVVEKRIQSLEQEKQAAQEKLASLQEQAAYAATDRFAKELKDQSAQLTEQVKVIDDQIGAAKASIALPSNGRTLAAINVSRERLAQELQAIDTQMMSASPFKREQLEAKKTEITKRIEDLQKRERGVEEGMAPGPQPNVDPAPAVPTEDIDRGIHSAGSSKKEFVESVNESISKISAYFGAGFNISNPVSFAHALPYAISALGPEAQIEFSKFAKEAAARDAEEKAQQQAMYAGGEQGMGGEQPWMTHFQQRQAAVSAQTGDKYDQQLGSLHGQIQENLNQQAYMRKQFAEAQEMQSWTAVIAYALLSVLIGPQAAFVFFSNARQKGKLKDWLAQLEAEMEHLRDQERYTRTEAAYARREAARQMQRSREREEDKMFDIYKMGLQDRAILKRMALAHPEGESAVKKLQLNLTNEMSLARTAKARMDAADRIILDPYTMTKKDKDNAISQKKTAERTYNFHIDNVMGIHNDIRRLSGLSYYDEEEDADLEGAMEGGP